MSKIKTSIGGQALIEGIMMKGPYRTLMAVRCKDGVIDLSDVKETHLKDKCSIFGWPLIRGMVNLVESMIIGYKCLMKSADISGFTDLEEETEKTEKDEKKESVLVSVATVIGSVLGVVLSVVLFMCLFANFLGVYFSNIFSLNYEVFGGIIFIIILIL